MNKSTCPTGRPQFATRKAANGQLGRLRRLNSPRHQERDHFLCPWCLMFHLSLKRRRRRRKTYHQPDCPS